MYLLLVLTVLAVMCVTKGYAKDDDEFFIVWVFWFLYIMLFMISVEILFAELHQTPVILISLIPCYT